MIFENRCDVRIPKPTLSPSKAWSSLDSCAVPYKVPSTLREKKTTWTPHTNIITSAWCHFTNISPFLQLELTTVHRGHQHHQLCFIQLPNHRLSGNRIHGMGALSCAATSHQGSWNGPMQPWGGVEQYIQHGSSSLEFIYTLYQTWY